MSPGRWLLVHWKQITLLVTLVGAVVIAYWLIILTSRVNRVEATRLATITAAYAQCVGFRPLLRQLNAAFVGAETVADVLLVNAEATHATTKRGTPLYATQEANIARLRIAIQGGAGVRIPVPTMAECKARRDAAL